MILVAAVAGGIWVNIYTGRTSSRVLDLGWTNVLLLVAAAAVVCQLLAGRLEVKYTREDAEMAVKDLLEVAARAIAFPLPWTSIQMRAHCYKYDPAKDRLRPVAHCSSHEHADNWAPIPCDKRHAERFVIVKALQNDRDLNEEFLDKTDLEKEVGVWKDLHTVIAAPVRIEDGDETHIVGVVNFDSSLYEDQIKFGTAQAHDIAI